MDHRRLNYTNKPSEIFTTTFTVEVFTNIMCSTVTINVNNSSTHRECMSPLPKGCCGHGIPSSGEGGTSMSISATRAATDHTWTRSSRPNWQAAEAFTVHSSLMSELDMLH